MPAHSNDAARVEVARVPSGNHSDPVRRTLPYVEASVEYPGLDADRFGGGFFPVAVPYEGGGERRVFFWRSVLPATAPASDDWTFVAASPYGVSPATGDATGVDVTGDGGRAVVVEGTVGGDSTEAVLEEPVDHDVTVGDTRDSAVVARTRGGDYVVDAGERRRIALPERTVSVGDESVAVEPELVVRYPSTRTFYHPAPDASYDLFPSFGVSLSDVPERVAVEPGAEVDDAAVADAFGVDLDARPYAERVLWQAFAHTAFGDPDPSPTLTQFSNGLLGLWTD
ncbi:MAG: hypothetical protein ABEJ88_06480 [Halobacterium sp.]